MSLVETYVHAVDGHFYSDPILSGDDWFICFDDDEPPEIVVAERNRHKAETRAVAVLLELKIGDAAEFDHRSTRCFPRPPKHRDSCCFFFKLTGPIPVPPGAKPVTSEKRLSSQGVFYDPVGAS